MGSEWGHRIRTWQHTPGRQSVTEIDAKRAALVRVVLATPKMGFDCPDAIAVAGRHVWVANICGDGRRPNDYNIYGSVSELDANTGAPIGEFPTPATDSAIVMPSPSPAGKYGFPMAKQGRSSSRRWMQRRAP